MKKPYENDPIPSCESCEFASPTPEGTVYCHKKKKERDPDTKCHGYRYDLLKRDPLSRPTLPRLDPDLLGDDM